MTCVTDVRPELRAFFELATTAYIGIPFVAETTGGIEPIREIRDQDLEVGILSPTRPRHAVLMSLDGDPVRLSEIAGAAIRSNPWLNIKLKEWFDRDFDPERKTGPVLAERIQECMEEIASLNRDALGMSDTCAGVPAFQPGTMLDFVHWVIDYIVTPMFVLVSLRDVHPFPDSTLSSEGLYHARENDLRNAREVYFAKQASTRRMDDGPLIM